MKIIQGTINYEISYSEEGYMVKVLNQGLETDLAATLITRLLTQNDLDYIKANKKSFSPEDKKNAGKQQAQLSVTNTVLAIIGEKLLAELIRRENGKQ